MTRVLFVIPGLGAGGAERSLAAELPGLVARGIDPIVACFFKRSPGVHADVTDAGIPVHVLEGNAVSRVDGLRRLIRSSQPDLVHTSVLQADITGRLAAFSLGVPCVSTLVNTTHDPARLVDPQVSRLAFRAYRAIDSVTAKRCVGHRALTETVKASATQWMGLNGHQIVVIPRGRDLVGLRFTAEDRQAAREALGIQPDEFVVGNVARHEYQKGLDTLVAAMALVQRRNPSVAFVQAGRPGNHSAAIERSLETHDLDPRRARFLGYRSDVPSAILPALDLFVFPSRYEGLGGAALEAMAAGLPIVASDVAVLREVLGDQARFVPPEDADRLASAIEVAALERTTPPITAARERGRRFDIESVSESVSHWLHDAAGADPASPMSSDRSDRRAQVRAGVDRFLATKMVYRTAWRLIPGDVRVLAYHGVPDQARFDEHLDVIQACTRPISLDDIIAAVDGAPLPPRASLVTFDDGDVSVLANALPSLSARAIPSVSFVVAGLVGTSQPYWWVEATEHLRHEALPPAPFATDPVVLVRQLKRVPDRTRRRVMTHLRNQRGCIPTQANLSELDLRTMENSGMAIGNHSWSHPCLDMCDADSVVSEVMQAHHALSEMVGQSPAAFAYPNGNVDARVEHVVRSSGASVAFLFDHAPMRVGQAPMRVSRLRIDAQAHPDRLSAVLSGAHPKLLWLRG